MAIHFGADAVYLGGKDFSLRHHSGNFDREALQKAIAFAHRHRVKVYVACNIFPRNAQLDPIREFLRDLEQIHPDAVIIADPGILALARKAAPRLPLHLSTQANTTNLAAARFWQDNGIRRINVARELSLDEIRILAEETRLEIEAFVHGAMCIAYSGRCLLSNFMAGRDSNQGQCSHPCRWSYAVVEETRPGQYQPIMEDTGGTTVFHSKDLCMLDYLPEMIRAGVQALKIEGRMKGIHYVATAVKVYREALDAFFENPDGFSVRQEWRDLLADIGHRGYCTGFYLGNPDETLPNVASGGTREPPQLVGKVEEAGSGDVMAVDVRNTFAVGDPVEVPSPGRPVRKPCHGGTVGILRPPGFDTETETHGRTATPMTDLLLPKSYKHAFPFKIGTTSYIYPGPILLNVQRLAPFLDEIELLLFEGDQLPGTAEIDAVARVAEATGLTFNVHLPLDLALGDPEQLRRTRSVDIVKKALERTARLSPSSACLHLDPGLSSRNPEAIARWQERCAESLTTIQQWRGDLAGIAVENLSFPLEWIEELITAFDLSVCLDIGHLFRYGFDAENTHAQFEERIAVMHLHGVSGNKDHLGLDRMHPERRNRTRRLMEGFLGVVSVEVFGFDPLAASLAVLEQWGFDT